MGKAVAKSSKRAWRKLDAADTEVRLICLCLSLRRAAACLYAALE
jgi:hypothetical protein